jgi:uncharacterized RDD family membrane protein YckC
MADLDARAVPATTAVLGRRVVAFLIDAVLHTFVVVAVFMLTARQTTDSYEVPEGFIIRFSMTERVYFLHDAEALAFLLFVIGLAVVHLVVRQGYTGASLGKEIMGLRVVGDDGAPCGVGPAFVRWLFWFVDDFPYFIPGLVGFIVAAVTPDHRRVGDIVARTRVVDCREGDSSAMTGHYM